MRQAAVVFLILAAAACPDYDYEEEVFLETDGSGEIRIHGEATIFSLLHGIEPVTEESLRAFFGEVEAGLTLSTVRPSDRNGRRFYHLVAEFGDWNDLCNHPAFASRPCRLESKEGMLWLTAGRPSLLGKNDGPLPAGALTAFRVHFPSPVLYHNAPTGLERGNILRWESGLGQLEPLAGALPQVIEARFDEESVFSVTVKLLIAAFLLVGFVIVAALVLMRRKGLRQLHASGSS